MGWKVSLTPERLGPVPMRGAVPETQVSPKKEDELSGSATSETPGASPDAGARGTKRFRPRLGCGTSTRDVHGAEPAPRDDEEETHVLYTHAGRAHALIAAAIFRGARRRD